MIQEMLAGDEEIKPDAVSQHMAQVRALIVKAASEGEVGRRYQAAIQREPSVVVEHGRAVKSMG